MPKTHEENIRNDKKWIGFEYQYWFFLWRILELKTGESVGLEVSDDVDTQLNNSRQVLFQLKHTLGTNAAGAPVPLRKYDPDLWKTLSNWSQVIADDAAGRTNIVDQLNFIEKTEFVLVSNKSDVTDSNLRSLFDSPETAEATLKTLQSGTSSDAIRGYMDNLLTLDSAVLRKFLEHTSFMLGEDVMIARCETAIREKQIREDRVKALLRDVDSQIRQDSFFAIKAGQPVCISFDDFRKRYRGYFDNARSNGLIVRDDYDPLPGALEEQTFIKQLIDISDLSADDISRIARFTECKQRLKKNLTTWELDGDITGKDIEAFDRDAMFSWENSFNMHHRNLEVEDVRRGLAVLDTIRQHLLAMKGESLGPYVSNGQFYRLADIPSIGFLSNWQELYGRNTE